MTIKLHSTLSVVILCLMTFSCENDSRGPLSDDQVEVGTNAPRDPLSKEGESMMLNSVQLATSQALKWRVEVLGDVNGMDSRYDISDPITIQHLSKLMISNRELEISKTDVGVAPYVLVDLVYGQPGGEVSRVEVGGDILYVAGPRRRYMVVLSSQELYQRLVDKNFVFPKEPVSQRESDVPPDPPPTEVKEGSGVQLESRRDRNDLTLNRRPLPERNAPILDDLPSASPRRNLPPASPTRTRRLGPPQKSVGPGNADRDVPGAVPTLPELPPVRNRHVRRTGPPVVPPVAPPQ